MPHFRPASMLGVTCVHHEMYKQVSRCSSRLYRFTDYYIGEYLLGTSEAPLDRTRNGEPIELEYVHGTGKHIAFDLVPHYLVQHMGCIQKLISHIRETVCLMA